MRDNVKYAFIYENLETLDAINDTTKLCIYKPAHKLFLVKKTDAAAKACYEAIAEIENPHIARVLYLTEADGFLYVMREYISGDTLAQLLNGGKQPDEAATVQITADICDGLAALHARGLIHRDINPNNIIVAPNGHATVIDFGIARSFHKEKATDTAILGTPGYAAPEQFGFAQSDARTDIYAVGVLLNVMLTGKPPHEKCAPGSMGRIVRKCTEIDSAKRYATMEALSRALGSGLAGTAAADRFIDLIPGLRSRRVIVVVLAAIWYFAVLLFSVAMFATAPATVSGIFSMLVSWLLVFIVPFFCFCNFLGIWDRLPFTKGATRKSQKTIYISLGIISLLVGLCLFGSVNA